MGDQKDKQPISRKHDEPVGSVKPGIEPRPVTPAMFADITFDRTSINHQQIIRDVDEQFAKEDKRSLSHCEAEQARATARRLKIASQALVWCATLFALYEMFANDSPVGFVMVLPAVIAARYLLRKRNRTLAPMNIVSYERAISEKFMLFLRSFGMDERKTRWDDPLADSMEMEITLRMRKAGWVVAVGRPGERNPPAGANRVYLHGSEWQSKVAELVKHARLVVLAVGESGGVLWELRQSFKLLTPEKLILFLPFQFQDEATRTETWASLRAVVAEAGVVLPAQLSSGLFITFGAAWTPRIVEPVLPPSEQISSDLREARVRRGIIEAMNGVFPYVNFETSHDAMLRQRSVGFVGRKLGAIHDRIRNH